MFRAKERGRGRYEIFDEDMRRRVIERLTVEEGLRAALRTDAFEVFYQPIVSLEDHRIVAVEALVRWIHPTHGIVAPAEFIPVAEESGLIIPIGRRVLLEACRQAARWAADPGIGDFYMSVNLSGRQLAEPGFPEEVTAALHRTGLAPERLALEVTETVLIEKTTSPTATLQRLKDTGVRLLLDDFGTGYSSLNYVKHLPVDAIKVDRSFVASLADGESDRQILAAVASMGKALGIEIVAEGLEDVEQARWLRRLGIALGQGYGFARPAPAAEIEVLLRDGLPVDRLAGALAPLPAWAAAAEPAPGGEADRGTTVTLAEAATALGVSGSTVRRWADTGRLRSVRTRGGHRRFPVAEVRRLSAAVAGTASPALREVPLPSHGLEALATLLESRGDDLVTATSRVLYDARRTGWFAAPSAEEPLGRWVAELAAAARSGDWKRAADATRRLIAQSHHAGSSLAERHGFLERFSEAAIRSLQKEQAEQQVIVETRRLFLNLRRLTLTFPEGRAS
jgi:excisionase family DNA binding protein